MLTNPGKRIYLVDEDQDAIHNYYERLVLQEICNASARVQGGDRDFLADVACVALNRLPPRYIRHDVDMTFFMSPQELAELEEKITAAVNAAIAYVESRESNDGSDEPLENSAHDAPQQKEKNQQKEKKPVEAGDSGKAAGKKTSTRKPKK